MKKAEFKEKMKQLKKPRSKPIPSKIFKSKKQYKRIKKVDPE